MPQEGQKERIISTKRKTKKRRSRKKDGSRRGRFCFALFVAAAALAGGVQMEAESLNGDEIKFNIFVFNVRPGIRIDYATGDGWAE